jgi:hypothetical protein
MTTPPSRSEPVTIPRAGPGLRLRLWLACLLPPLAAAGLVAAVIAARQPAGLDPALLWVWLPAGGGLGVLVALIMAAWLDRHLVGHLAGLVRGVAGERVTDLRGLPSSAGWGELSELTQQVQQLLSRHRNAQRAASDLETLLLQLARLREGLERWNRTERWEPLPGESGVLAPVAGLLNRAMVREQSIRDDNAVAARQVRGDLTDAALDARESAEQAERGFVEATALLTTVRELHRLGGELTLSLERLAVTPAVAGAPPDLEPLREAASKAIVELVAASAESVEHLATGMTHVHEIADHVQRLANRATLIALQVVAGGPAPESQGEQLKRLARDVREATERTSALAADIESEVAAATARMGRVRTDVAARLEKLPTPAMPGPAGPVPATLPEEAARLLERVREMIADAAKKGERLSSAGERASRAAQRLVRRIDDELRELDGLVVRLSPVSEGPAAPSAEPPRSPAEPPSASSVPGPLRLLGRERRDAEAEPRRAQDEEST